MDASVARLISQVQERQVELVFDLEQRPVSIGPLSLTIPTPVIKYEPMGSQVAEGRIEVPR